MANPGEGTTRMAGRENPKMAEDRVSRMQRRVLGILEEEMRGWIDDQMKGMLDPAKIMAFARALGIDMSQLSVGGQGAVDPYRILGLDRSASDEEVKKRYHELVQKLHPDTAGMKEGRGTEFLFQMVQAAYEMIKVERG